MILSLLSVDSVISLWEREGLLHKWAKPHRFSRVSPILSS